MRSLWKACLALCLCLGAAFVVPSFAQTAQPSPPGKTSPAPGMKDTKAKSAAEQLIDINTASEEELRSLKGVGDIRAANIIRNRPYQRKDELVQKKIIPEAVYAGIKDKIIAKQQ
jgi:DNA uptake protein ComE-like DNA-binding protein